MRTIVRDRYTYTETDKPMAIGEILKICQKMSYHKILFACLGCQGIDLAFLIDSSGSINEADQNNWSNVQTFIELVISRLDLGVTQVGVVQFSVDILPIFYLNTFSEKALMYTKIDNAIPMGQNTYTANGLR